MRQAKVGAHGEFCRSWVPVQREGAAGTGRKGVNLSAEGRALATPRRKKHCWTQPFQDPLGGVANECACEQGVLGVLVVSELGQWTPSPWTGQACPPSSWNAAWFLLPWCSLSLYLCISDCTEVKMKPCTACTDYIFAHNVATFIFFLRLWLYWLDFEDGHVISTNSFPFYFLTTPSP